MSNTFQQKIQSNAYLLLSIIGGVLLGLATNKVAGITLAPLAWFCLVPLFYALKNSTSTRNYFVHAYIFSFIFLSLALAAFVLQVFLGGFLLIAIGALVFTIPFWAIYLLKNKIGFRNSLYLLPFIWPVFDWFLLEKLLAMPILSIYINQAALPWLIQYIDITGYTGISFWLVSLNVYLFVLMDDWPTNKEKDEFSLAPFFAKRLAILLGVFFVLPLVYNLYVTTSLPSSLGKDIRVSVVQSKYPELDEAGDSMFVMGFNQIMHVTDSLIKADETDLIIWPESGVPADFKKEEGVQTYLFQKVLEWEAPLLTGTLDTEVLRNIPKLQQYLNRDEKYYNSAVMITPQLAWMALQEDLDIEQLKVYRKQNLMYFTEYVPLSETFPILSNLSINIGGEEHISSGNGPTSLRFATQNQSIIDVSPVVCWDLLFTTSSSKSTASKADFIAALTNESPLGSTLSTTSHEIESFTRLRSIESRRSIAKSSTTGYSFFTDPFGKVYGKLPWYSIGASTQSVTLSSINSWYSKYPNAFPFLCLIIGFAILAYQYKVQLSFNKLK